MPYDTVVVTDFADLECEASAKSVAVCATREQQQSNRNMGENFDANSLAKKIEKTYTYAYA